MNSDKRIRLGMVEVYHRACIAIESQGEGAVIALVMPTGDGYLFAENGVKGKVTTFKLVNGRCVTVFDAAEVKEWMEQHANVGNMLADQRRQQVNAVIRCLRGFGTIGGAIDDLAEEPSQYEELRDTLFVCLSVLSENAKGVGE